MRLANNIYHAACSGPTRTRIVAAGLALFMALSARGQANGHAAGADCGSYDRPVARELELLDVLDRPTMVAARSPEEVPPRLSLGTAASVVLAGQSGVEFVAAPGRVTLDEGGYAGIVAVMVPKDGRYRVSLTNGSWIDVIAGKTVLESAAFAGRAACRPLRKLVEYELEAGRHLMQISGATDETIGVVVTTLE